MNPEDKAAAEVYLQNLIDNDTGVADCARCGGTHESLSWHRFDRPPKWSDQEIITAWAMCPVSYDPILFFQGTVQDGKEVTT